MSARPSIGKRGLTFAATRQQSQWQIMIGAAVCRFPVRPFVATFERMAKAAKAPRAAAKVPSKKPAAAKVKPAAAKPAAAKAKLAAAAKAKPAAKPASAAPEAAASGAGSGVVIVSNKVCNAFKTRAEGLRKAILAAKPSASVTVDEQKALGRAPDRGTFAVTVAGKSLVELPAMPRPFTAMKALDMDALAKQVIALL